MVKRTSCEQKENMQKRAAFMVLSLNSGSAARRCRFKEAGDLVKQGGEGMDRVCEGTAAV